ncbi:MAG: tandem-95 repeat protein, partial [Chitinophagaceae bacterium]|nr:tandem-95 repeat protein [Chitinophagaceae bacterium]
MSFWEHVNGSYIGGASIYEGDYTGRTPNNPIPSKLSTLTSSTAFQILTADNTNSARDEVVSTLQKVPIINGYRYANAVKLGNSTSGAQADKMTYRLTVPAGLSSYNITYAFAMVLDDAGHSADIQPAFVANVLDLSRPVGQQKITCGSKAYNASTPGLITLGSVKYSNWQEVSFDLSQYGGKQIEINFQAMDCAAGGHYGYAYFTLRSENFSGLLSGQSVICNNSGNLTYTTPAIDGATYNWTVPAGWTGTSTTNSITVNPNGNSGTISVTPSQSCGNIFSNSLNVTVANGVPADPGPITGTNTVCANGSVGSSNLSYSIDAVLNATEYEWTLPTGWTIIGGYGTRSITVNLASNASSGTMSVRAKNACGYSNTSSRQFTVLASQPSVGGSISPSNVALSCPQSNTLTLSGVTGTVTQWESSTDGGFSWSEVSSSAGLISLSVSPSTSTFYRAVLTNGSCPSAVSSNSLINVKSPPNIVTQPFDKSICSGTATTFSVVASGDDLSYQWFVSTDGGSNFTAISNGGVYSGATLATLSLSSGINNTYNNYKYRVKVTSTCDNIGITSNTVGLYIYTSANVNITSQPASVTVTQGSTTTLRVVAEGPGLSYQWKSSSDNVNFTNVSGANNDTYTPPTSSTGYSYYTVTVSSSSCSGSANQTSNTATLLVRLFNQNPVGVNDNNTGLEDSNSIIGNVLSNDSDPTGDTLTVTQFVVAGLSGNFSASQTATIANVGTLQINDNGSYIFIPLANYNGIAPTVTYTISDGNGGTTTASLIITISPVNDNPLAVNDTKSINEDASSATGNVLTNDSDVDGDALSVTQFVIAGLNGTFTAGQTATIAGVGTLQINANGNYTFVPTANYNGSAPTVTYSISDGNGGTATATLIIRTDSVNDIPIAVNDTKSVNEDASSATGNVLTNDSDVDGDVLSVTQFVVAGLNNTYTPGQTVTISGVGTLQINANGSYTFVPTANYNGIAPTVTYSITDGFGGTGSATLIITVSSINDIPLAVNDNFQLDGYNSFTSNVLTNDLDSDGDALAVTQFIVAGLSGTFNAGQTANIPNVGTLVINTNGTFIFNPLTTFGGNVPNVTYTVADTNNGVATAILAIVLLSDIDGDGTADYLDPDPNDGCVWDPTQRNIPTSIAWKAADCDGDGTPNGTDSAPLDYCVGRVGFTIPKLGTAAYNNFFKNSDCD